MRIRFSLKSIIGIMMIFGLALGWWNSTRSYAKMSQRYTLLFMDWVQPLEVKDPDLIYHRKLKMNEASLHHWKVYLPQGKRYDLECVVPCTLDMPGDELEYVAARIPMPEGRSLVEMEWRLDSRRMPHLSIARLGTTPETTIKEFARFPTGFERNFSRNGGCTEHVTGWLASNPSFVVPRLTLVEGLFRFQEPFRTRTGPSAGIDGFHVRLRAVGDATTAATNTPSTTKGVDTKAPASSAGKD